MISLLPLPSLSNVSAAGYPVALSARLLQEGEGIGEKEKTTALRRREEDEGGLFHHHVFAADGGAFLVHL